jgi:hypothetical protein
MKDRLISSGKEVARESCANKASFSQAATAVKDGDVPMLNATENIVALSLPSKKKISILFPKAP